MVLSYAVNWVAVIVTAVVGFVVGMIWWGPLFGKQWMKLAGKTEQDKKKMKERGMAGTMVTAFIANIVMAFVLSVLLLSTGAVSVSDGIIVAFLVWLGFVATISIGMVLWDGKPMGLFWLSSVGWLVIIEIMSVVLSVWG